MRRRPSAATVLALLALFVSLSGTAIASVIITSNSQVASHVISGAAGPARDNKNLIPGSVGSTDLHAGSVTGTRLASGSITTSKLALPKIAMSVADTDPNDGAPHHTLLSLDGVTLGLNCFSPASGVASAKLFLSGPTGEFRGSQVVGASGNPTSAAPFEQTTPDTDTPFAFWSGSSGTVYNEIQMTYHNSTRVITFSLDASAQGANNLCDVYGTALPAPN